MIIDQENLVRILSDKPQLETKPLFCFFGLHRWTKWSNPELTASHTDYYQNRVCIYCNKGQNRVFR